MKIIVAGVVAALLVPTGAFAADAVVYEEPVIAPIAPVTYNWTGVYVGLHAGYGFGDVDGSLSVPTGSTINALATSLATTTGNRSFDTDGFVGGVQIGANYQINQFVLGAEAELSFADLDDTGTSGIITNGPNRARTIDTLDMDYMGAVRARAGVAMDRLLVFGTGGLAFTDAEVTRYLDWDFVDGCPPVDSGLQRCHVGSADFDVGYTVGAGVEYAFADNFSAKLEYTYTDFGNADFRTVNATIPTQPLDHSFDLDIHTVRAGINYKFGG